MKKLTATFEFTESYKHINWSDQKTSVLLDIDYSSKTFSVLRGNSCDQNFRFHKDDCRNYNRWMAELKCIQRAIEFGNIEIGLANPPH